MNNYNNHTQSPNNPHSVILASGLHNGEKVNETVETASNPPPLPPTAQAAQKMEKRLPLSASHSKSPSVAFTRPTENSSLTSSSESIRQERGVEGPQGTTTFPSRNNIGVVEAKKEEARPGAVWVAGHGPGDRPPPSWGSGSSNGNTYLHDDNDDNNDDDADIISTEKTSLSRAGTTVVNSSLWARTSLCEGIGPRDINGSPPSDDPKPSDGDDAGIISTEKTSLRRAGTTVVNSSLLARTSLCEGIGPCDINGSPHNDDPKSSNRVEGNEVVEEQEPAVTSELASGDGPKNRTKVFERASVLATFSLAKNDEKNDGDNSEWRKISEREKPVRPSVLEKFQKLSKEEIETLPQAELIRASMRGRRAFSSSFLDASGLFDSFYDWVEASFKVLPLATPISDSAVQSSWRLAEIIEKDDEEEEEEENEITSIPKQRPRLERGAGKARRLSLDHLLRDWEEKKNSLSSSRSGSFFLPSQRFTPSKKREEHFRNLIRDFSKKRKRDDDLVDMLEELFFGNRIR